AHAPRSVAHRLPGRSDASCRAARHAGDGAMPAPDPAPRAGSRPHPDHPPRGLGEHPMKLLLLVAATFMMACAVTSEAQPRPDLLYWGKQPGASTDRKSTRLNSSHDQTSYAVFCLKK